MHGLGKPDLADFYLREYKILGQLRGMSNFNLFGMITIL